MRRPSVTVVVPCYNYGRFLPTAVGSVLGQAGVDVDVIVVDDASTDGSEMVARSLATADDRVQAVVHERNRGHIATYNEGLEQARGDYIVLLSADDALPQGALGRATALLEAHPSVGLAYGHPVVFTDQLPLDLSKLRSWSIWSGQEWITRRCRAGRNCIMSPEVVMRASVQRAIGGYDAGLPHSGDLEMWMRAASVSDVGRVNGAVQGLYRVHSASMQRTAHAGHLVDLEAVLAAFEKALTGPSSRVRDGQALLDTAKRTLAATALASARSRFDEGRGDEGSIAEYLEFAARAWPATRRTRSWRTMTQAAPPDAPPADQQVRRLVRRAADKLRWRVRWRRWRWTGI